MARKWKVLISAIALAAIVVSAYFIAQQLGLSKTAIAAAEKALGEATVREPAVAGAFYPASPQALDAKVKEFIAAGKPLPASAGSVIALICPHAGYEFSGPTAGKTFATVQGCAVKRVLILGVSHYESPAPVWIDDVDAYRTPLGDVPVDREAKLLLKKEGLTAIAGAGRREHSIEVELPFLKTALPAGWSFVPILVGSAGFDDCARAARQILPAIDSSTLVVVSSDFTHYGANYGYVPFSGSDSEVRRQLVALDDGAVKLILARNAKGFADYVDKTGATICGRAPITILLNMLPAGAQGHEIARAMSGDMGGGFAMSVSYAGIAFTSTAADVNPWTGKPERAEAMPETKQLTAEEKKTLLVLARRSLEASVLGHKGANTSDLVLTDTLKTRRGAFVTLEIGQALRGCIGYVDAREPLWQTVVENAYNAAMEDPRFPSVTAGELKSIHIEISAMTPLETITDVKKIEVGKHGIMLTRGYYRGLLLPQVATEYGWNREEFLMHTCEKAGLPDNAWKDPATKIEIFSAEVFGEETK